jgi:hypothetical protein
MKRPLKAIGAVLACGLLACGAAAAADSPAAHAAHLTEAPLVMRLGKDEFRIAFSIDAHGCAAHGCYGVIRYRVAWRTEDGTVVSDLKRVTYSVPPHYVRAMTVDRQYFDTAEGAHTTDLLHVTVAGVSYKEGALPPIPAIAVTAGKF